MFGTFALSVGAAVSCFLFSNFNFWSRFCKAKEVQYICGYYLTVCLGIQVGMEFWARWAHKALWHASLWHMHEVRILAQSLALIPLALFSLLVFLYFFDDGGSLEILTNH